MPGRIVILLVDDNQLFLERMVNLLEDPISPRLFLFANNFDEALARYNENQPDVVILDINLPGKSGLDLLKEIKKYSGKTIVIMMTNHSEHFYRDQSIESGAEYFLDKSNDFTLVPQIINELFGKV